MGKGDLSDLTPDSSDADRNCNNVSDMYKCTEGASNIRSRHTSSNDGSNGGVSGIRSRNFSSSSAPPFHIQLPKLGVGQPASREQCQLLKSQNDLSSLEKSDKIVTSKCRGYVILAILLLANLINYMDRYTIAGVLDDVQKFYSINNAEAGLLQTSFIISYMLLSPIFGYLGDRYNRKWIMASGILFWSIVTLAGSFVGRDKFGLFLFMRAMVGVGEASYSTIAPTIIADMFAKSMRTKALSVFYFAIPVGSGLGYIVGSKVALIMDSWQWSLRVTPILGIICTVLVLVVVIEPPRGASDGGDHLKSTSFKMDIIYLLKHKSFMLSSLGFTCVAFVAGALALWAPLYMYRSIRIQQDDVEMSTVSLIFGVITCAAGFLGVVIGLFAASKLRSRTTKADPLVCAFGLIAGAPFLFFAIVLSKHYIYATWVLIFIGETLISLNWALVTDMLLYIVIPTRRSSAEALQILLSHALGDAGSPYLVGVVSDYIESTYESPDLVVQYLSLQYALYMACFVCVIGGAFFLATALFIQHDKVKTDQVIKGSMESSSDGKSSLRTGSDESMNPTPDITESSDTMVTEHEGTPEQLDSRASVTPRTLELKIFGYPHTLHPVGGHEFHENEIPENEIPEHEIETLANGSVVNGSYYFQHDPKENGHVLKENGHVLKENGHVLKEIGHVPMENGHVLKENGHILKENGHVLKENGHVPKGNGHVSKENGHVLKENGHVPKENGYVSKENGYVSKDNGHVLKDNGHSNGQVVHVSS